jgi:23S rRNA (adenine-N6)-dimethyltransferase
MEYPCLDFLLKNDKIAHMLSDSQNFINNNDLVKICLDLVELNNKEKIIEIGGGKGIITKELLKRFGKLTVIEFDKALSVRLKKIFLGNKNIEILNQDFLEYRLPNTRFNIISNIPFNITSNIIRKITDKNSQLNKAYLIMQKEAALKFVPINPRDETSLLSNLIQIEYEISYLLDIDKGNFTPRPKYDASFVCFEKKPVRYFKNIQTENLFKDFICYLFNRSRPILIDALTEILNKKIAHMLLKELEIDPKLRIKSVTFKEWLVIFNNLTLTNLKSTNKIKGSYKKQLLQQNKVQKVNRTRRY